MAKWKTVNSYCASCAGGPEFKSRDYIALQFAIATTTIQVAVLPCQYAAKMSIANSLHASASVLYNEHNEKFG